MIYFSEISWRHSWDFGTLAPNIYDFLVCLSVCQLADFLTDIRRMQGYLQFWMRYFSEIFLIHSWDVCTDIPINSYILVCLSVCQLAHFITEIRQIQGYFQFWIKHLSDFLSYSLDFSTQAPNNSEFPVHLSVWGYLQFYMIFFSEYYEGIPMIFL